MKSNQSDKKEDFFSSEVSKKEQRKLKALRNKNSVWFGLGLMGMVGWSVAVPSLAGASLGLWLDKLYPQSFSWALTLLLVGIIIGGVIAWYWVLKENKEIHKNKDDSDE
ncbi:AtpZ/AtpI family protein [Polaribacter litorisediminis]|uniref:AtpZ/AtpI family protein n=1 Tax=Polaribacter litorisediminis TaxID=1908341 RepID=UPI001CBEBE94|nr:AtpZ/AtpI family protein [Polaribacter litorisediminis]UAM98166.1 AtpZ/AtpI family protein [Polaribacter litorisediminis]